MAEPHGLSPRTQSYSSANRRRVAIRLTAPDEAKAVKREKRREKEQVDGIEAQRMVVEQGAEYWSQWLAYGKSVKQLNPKEAGILEACCLLPRRAPSEKQSIAALDIVDRLSAHYQNASATQVV